MASYPLAFGELLAGAIMLDYGAKALSGAFSAAPAAASPAGAGGTSSGPLPTGTEKQQIQAVATKYGLSPNTLWGIFGVESSFGADPSTSSAGAQGPFQFIPSTWATYGHGNVQNFSDALDAAARLLKALGADANPSSAGTIRAMNNYNGNGGGTSLTSYASKAIQLGAGF